MEQPNLINFLRENQQIASFSILAESGNELYLLVGEKYFGRCALALHEALPSPVMAMFAEDNRSRGGMFRLYVSFYSSADNRWYHVCLDVPADNPSFPSLAKEIYSASLFEREIREMFGIKPEGNPDLRRLRLHDEVWPEGQFPLRKDFTPGEIPPPAGKAYAFIPGEGEGLFEVPVGPVHAGVIGPGHFRFSAAGEPIINLEIRLGFTHRGAEKLMEGKTFAEALKLAECISGDAAFAHSLAFCLAAEKISAVKPPFAAELTRAVFLELERIYNHVNDIGGIALDVGFTFPAAFAQIMKENLLQLNARLSGSRYLKGINIVGGVGNNIKLDAAELINRLVPVAADLAELEKMLFDSASFMDRVDSTGILRKSTAEDIGAVGLVARASGLTLDLRARVEVYQAAGFEPVTCEEGDVLARLKVRLAEARQSINLIYFFVKQLAPDKSLSYPAPAKEGFNLGAAEAWRGPVIYWIKTNSDGLIERCKIVDPSFHNWQGLSFAVQGEIIPDFPLCNKSFDLSYSGNDL